MPNSPELLYLDLLKKTLSFTLWPEPPMPISTFSSRPSALKRMFVSTISSVLNLKHLQLVRRRKITESERTEGKNWPGYADTMIGMKRLDNLQYCVETVLADKVDGDFIETGVWRGGACIFMRAILAAHGVTDRKIYVADSFEGLPKPEEEKYSADKGDRHHVYDFLAVSKDEVQSNFQRYGLLDDQVVFLKGWFKDTLPHLKAEKLAIIRLDGDMYSSTMDALNNLYSKLSVGGFCIIDDYALEGCKLAVADFRKQHSITSEIKQIDWTGAYWRKEC